MRSSQAIPELLRVSEMSNRHLKRREFLDRAAETLIIAFASIAIAIILLIFVYVGREAMPLLWENTDGASVASTITPRQACVVADGKRHRAPRGVDLFGELRTAR
jgi:hypothetical protein